MFLDSISILNYKNISEANYEFSPGINCFLGNNGVGKTNMLDSIYYLACTKSRSSLPDAQNLKHGEQMFMLQGNFRGESNMDSFVIQAGYKNGGKKSFKLNGKEYQRFADHIGLIPIVIVSPTDSNLISDWSDNRRRFIDGVISQYSKEYLNDLLSYNKLLLQRNTLLKQQSTDAALFEICEHQMADCGERIYNVRKAFITDFVRVFGKYYSLISGGDEEVSIVYRSDLHSGNFASQLEYARRVDLIVGHTTKGIHKDDIDLMLGEHLIRKIGSQGQQKSFLLALKFAQFNYLKMVMERTPILLLDDIFDKLDSKRMEQIIKIVSGGEFGQIFITDTNRANLDLLLEKSTDGDFRIFSIGDAVNC